MQFGNPEFIVVLTTLITLVALICSACSKSRSADARLSAAGQLAAKTRCGRRVFQWLAGDSAGNALHRAVSGARHSVLPSPKAHRSFCWFFCSSDCGLAAPYVVLSWNPAC